MDIVNGRLYIMENDNRYCITDYGSHLLCVNNRYDSERALVKLIANDRGIAFWGHDIAGENFDSSGEYLVDKETLGSIKVNDIGIEELALILVNKIEYEAHNISNVIVLLEYAQKRIYIGDLL